MNIFDSFMFLHEITRIWIGTLSIVSTAKMTEQTPTDVPNRKHFFCLQ